MRTGVLILALLLTTGLTGCLDVGERWDDLREELEVKQRFTDTVLLQEGQSFSASGAIDPTNPPQQQEDVGASWSTTFTVPNGTKTMQVLFFVSFEEDTTPPDPLPDPGLGDGQVRVYVTPPGDESQTEDEFYQTSGQGGFDFRRPVAGEWTVGFDQAIGQGEVRFNVDATVPVT